MKEISKPKAANLEVCVPPGIRYVVDAGRSKQKLLELGTSMTKYEVGWISKASAEQRAGRAGRTGPGHCYRLISEH